jgi:hypothetical protein
VAVSQFHSFSLLFCQGKLHNPFFIFYAHKILHETFYSLAKAGKNLHHVQMQKCRNPQANWSETLFFMRKKPPLLLCFVAVGLTCILGIGHQEQKVGHPSPLRPLKFGLIDGEWWFSSKV